MGIIWANELPYCSFVIHIEFLCEDEHSKACKHFMFHELPIHNLQNGSRALSVPCTVVASLFHEDEVPEA
jgi:hypothetical protein